MSSCLFSNLFKWHVPLSSTTWLRCFLLLSLSSTSTATCTCLRLGAMAWRCLVLCGDCHHHANGVCVEVVAISMQCCFLKLSPLSDFIRWELKPCTASVSGWKSKSQTIAYDIWICFPFCMHWSQFFHSHRKTWDITNNLMNHQKAEWSLKVEAVEA